MVEWSGILFYSYTGSIQNLKDFKITLEDILPMDKGTSVTTEFEYDSRYVDFLMKNPERLDWKHGIIHSHNNMVVFFSGTDEKDLENNAKAHNYYLSIVVNNKLDIIGKVGFLSSFKDTVEATFTALDEDGKEYIHHNKTLSVSKEEFISYNCNVEYVKETQSVYNEFVESVGKILSEVEKPKTFQSSYGQKSYSENYPNNMEYDFEEDFARNYNNFRSPQKKVSPQILQKQEKIQEIFSESTVFEKFIMLCFGVDIKLLNKVELDTVLMDMGDSIEKGDMNADYLMESFCEKFSTELPGFFPEKYKESDIIEGLTETLEDNLLAYPFLEQIYNIFKYAE